LVTSNIYARLAAFFAALLVCGTCRGAEIAFIPVQVRLSENQPYAVVAVRNYSLGPVTFETSLFKWRQSNGSDELIPSEDLVVSPPIFVVQPGKSQTVRIRLLDAPDAAAETQFRIIFNELASTTRNKVGFLVAMEVSLPIFVAPIGTTSNSVETLVKRSGDRLTMTVANQGNVHAQLSRVYREKNGLRDPDAVPTFGYVLPGNQRAWIFERPDFVSADALVVEFSDGREVRLPVPPIRQ
jgi:fimbrial chaperone protein